MKIVFCGTPDFALPSLRMLIESHHEIAGVFVQPDRPVGRKAVLQAPPVKALALENGLPVYQYADMRRPEALAALRGLSPDLMVTASFGQILSQENLDVPPMGCVNVHGSLLPKYRGASPIQSAVIAGETVTGVTTMYTVLALDAGDMLLQKELSIGPDETAGELFERMAKLGADTLKETLAGLETGSIQPVPQDDAQATKSRMLKKKDGAIQWSWPAQRIHNLIRGCNPWPTAQSVMELDTGEKIVCKFWRSRLLGSDELAALEGREEPGARLRGPGDKGLYLRAGEGALEILEIQKAGGKRLKGEEFLRGHALCRGLSESEDL